MLLAAPKHQPYLIVELRIGNQQIIVAIFTEFFLTLGRRLFVSEHTVGKLNSANQELSSIELLTQTHVAVVSIEVFADFTTSRC